MNLKLIIYYFLLISVSSCFLLIPSHVSNDAYYSINDVSVRLVMKHDADTVYRTVWQQSYNLPGDTFQLLSSTDKLDTVSKLGIQLKFWASIKMKSKGKYYGMYPKNGLLYKISSIDLEFTNGKESYRLNSYLKGDSAIHNYMWRRYNYKKTPYWWGNSPYFEDLNSMIKSLNNDSELKSIPRHDYILWLEKSTLGKLEFKPNYLKVKVSLIDTLGVKTFHLTDSISLTFNK